MATETITLRLVAQDLASGRISQAVGKIDTLAKRGGLMGNVMQGVGIQFGMMLNPMMLAMRGFGMVKDAIGNTINAAADFEEAMTESLAIMGDVSDAMRSDMEQAARDVAETTRFSMTQAAESYFYLASAGLDAAKSVKAMPMVAQFAQAGMFDMAQATDLLTDAQSALGLTVDDTAENMENMARVSDVLVKANTLANATVEQFSTALTSKAGAALKAFGIDLEEGVAVLAAFADQGVKAEEAGNALDRILRLLPDAALKNADAYAEFGIAVFDASGEVRNMGDIIADMEVAFRGMSDAELQASLNTLGFQARVQGVIKPLLGASEKIKAYERQLWRAGGTTKDIAEKQLESFRAKLDLLGGQVETFGVTLGQFMIDPLSDLATTLNDDVIPQVERLVEDLLTRGPEARQLLAYTRAWEDLAEVFPVAEDALAGIRSEQDMLWATAASQGRVLPETQEEWLAVLRMSTGEQLAFAQAQEFAQERMDIFTLSKRRDGEATAYVTDKTLLWAEALALVNENMDDFGDLRPIQKINKAIDNQRRIMNKAAKEGQAWRWQNARAKLQELRAEREVNKVTQDALKAWKQQRRAIDDNADGMSTYQRKVNDLATEMDTTKKAAREALQATGGNADKARKKLEKVTEEANTLGATDPTVTVTADTSDAKAKFDALMRQIDALNQNSPEGTMLGIGSTVHTANATGGNSLVGKGSKKRRWAAGGVIRPGDWGTVGESGPERVRNIGGSVYVTPNGSGGSGITNVFHIGYARDARSFVDEVGPEMARWMRRQGVA